MNDGPFDGLEEHGRPVVCLSKSQAKVAIDDETARRALNAAFWATCSPHECQWSKADQEAMARYVLWACQRLSAIEDCLKPDGLQYEANA